MERERVCVCKPGGHTLIVHGGSQGHDQAHAKQYDGICNHNQGSTIEGREGGYFQQFGLRPILLLHAHARAQTLVRAQCFMKKTLSLTGIENETILRRPLPYSA